MKTMNRTMCIIVTALFCGLATAEIDDEQSQPRWEAACEFSTNKFRLIFNSPTGDVTADDMTVELKGASGSPHKILLNPAWYMPFEPPSNSKTLCRGLGGYKINNDMTLLVIALNGRPDWPHLAFVLLDPGNNVLAIINDAGEIPYKTEVALGPQSLKVKLASSWAQDKNSGAEYPVPSWFEVTVKNQKLVSQWLK